MSGDEDPGIAAEGRYADATLRRENQTPQATTQQAPVVDLHSAEVDRGGRPVGSCAASASTRGMPPRAVEPAVGGRMALAKEVKERDGVLESEQIRRALNDWLRKKGVKKADRKRAGTRKRP